MKKRHFFEAIATLVGTIIGAGILGIPYIVAKSGFLTGLIDIIIIGIICLLVNLYLGEIALRTKKDHQLTGYAEKYLGKTGKGLMAATMIFGIYGALIAYLLGEGEALKTIFGGSEIIYSLIFFAVVATIIHFGIKALEESELAIGILMLAIIILISALLMNKVSIENLAVFDATKFLIPYGVILFAFLGTSAIPEMKEELAANRKNLKKAIIIGSLIPIIIYSLFAFVVVGVIGSSFDRLGPDERMATVALGMFTGKGMAVFANLFAVLAMTTSFIALGYALKEMFNYDYNINKDVSWLLVVLVPLAVFLIDAFIVDVTNFIAVLGLTGAIAGGLTGVLIVLMHQKSKKHGERKPEYSIHDNKIISIIIALVFLIGVIYELLTSIGVISF